MNGVFYLRTARKRDSKRGAESELRGIIGSRPRTFASGRRLMIVCEDGVEPEENVLSKPSCKSIMMADS